MLTILQEFQACCTRELNLSSPGIDRCRGRSLSGYIATSGPNNIDGASKYGRILDVLGVVKVKAVGKPRRFNAGLIYLLSFRIDVLIDQAYSFSPSIIPSLLDDVVNPK